MGLNVVVGMAGLLDLGYAAFFAIGAYLYAFGASPFTHLHAPFLFLLVAGAVVAAVFGIALGAPTLRLRGDYLAIVTLGFGEIVPIVFLNAEKYTQGTNGIGGVDRPNIFGFQFPGIDQTAYFVLMAIVVMIVDGAHVPAPGFPDRSGLVGDPRGRARGSGQRHQHGHDEARRVRPGRDDGRASPGC